MTQLAFDLDSAVSLTREDIRASVAEPGMTPAEIDAAVRDALDRHEPVEALPAPPCVCVGVPMVFLDALAVDRRCARCGREPRR